MTPKTAREIQQAALSLNGTDKPFAIKTGASQIIGSWNILDAKWAGLLSGSQANKDYSICITLDELSHQFSYQENSGTSNKSFGLNADGSIGLSLGGSSFKGKQFGQHSDGIEIGLGMQQGNKPTQTAGVATYNFDNNQIKKPLLDMLQQGGWTEQKKSWLKKLFG